MNVSPAVKLLTLAGSASMLLSGCVSRTITVRTTPPGALVWLNDQEVGRTPMTKQFLWYGNYDVVIRADGYQTLKTNVDVSPPLWQFIPLDLFTDLLPLHFDHSSSFALEPLAPAPPDTVLARGEQLRTLLQSSSTTKPARTFARVQVKPTSRPATAASH